jgi:hypothetical protein
MRWLKYIHERLKNPTCFNTKVPHAVYRVEWWGISDHSTRHTTDAPPCTRSLHTIDTLQTLHHVPDLYIRSTHCRRSTMYQISAYDRHTADAPPCTRSLHMIDTHVCMRDRTVTNSCSTWTGLLLILLVLLILKHCGFMVINFMYFRIILSNILTISVRAT